MQILVIDDHELFRAGLKHLISGIGTPVEFHQAESVEQAIAGSYDSPIELILLDYHFPNMAGIDAIKAVKDHFPNSTVVVLSGDHHASLIREAIDHGAAGYIPKSVSHSVFLAAVKLVIAGEIYVPKQAISDIALLEDAPDYQINDKDSKPAQPQLDGLTERQKASLLLAIKGLPNKEIARNMNISEGTVKAHLSAAFKVLGVRNRTEAVLRFAEISSEEAAWE